MDRKTSRISCSPATLERMREFVRGLAATDYDEALNLMIDLLKEPGESDILAGIRIRYEQQEPSQDKSEGNRKASPHRENALSVAQPA